MPKSTTVVHGGPVPFPIPTERGSATWLFKTFRWQMLAALVADIKVHCPAGFDKPHVCPRIKEALSQARETLASMKTSKFLSDDLVKRFDKLQDSYAKWNDHDPNASGAIGRFSDHKHLTEIRSTLSKLASDTSRLGIGDSDRASLLKLWAIMDSLAKALPDYLYNLNMAVAQAKKRLGRNDR